MCAIDHLSFQLTFELFDGEISIPPIDRWNFPKTEREMVRIRSNGERVLEVARWGLEPQWFEPDPKISTYNARSDSLAEGKRLFRNAFARKRCLLFATSFIEHSDLRPTKIPIEVVPFGGKPFAYAGLFESAHRLGERVLSCTMVTCDPNELIGSFHSRMPVILPEEDWRVWLEPTSSREKLLSLLTPFPSDGMEVRDAVLPPRRVTKKQNQHLQSETLF